MKPTTIRLPEEVLEELDAEADEHDFHTRTEYLRYLIDHRELVISIALEQRRTRMDMLEDRLEEIEERLGEFETELSQSTGGPAPDAVVDAAPDLEASGEGDAALTEEIDLDTTEPESLGPIPEIEEENPEITEPLELHDPGPEDVEDRVNALDFFAPTRDIRADREAAVVAAWRTLVEYGELTREEFEELVFADHTAAFSSFDGWYDRLLVPALDQLEDVERADQDTWRYIGDDRS